MPEAAPVGGSHYTQAEKTGRGSRMLKIGPFKGWLVQGSLKLLCKCYINSKVELIAVSLKNYCYWGEEIRPKELGWYCLRVQTCN